MGVVDDESLIDYISVHRGSMAFYTFLLYNKEWAVLLLYLGQAGYSGLDFGFLLIRGRRIPIWLHDNF